jgi:hypothetical protein
MQVLELLFSWSGNYLTKKYVLKNALAFGDENLRIMSRWYFLVKEINSPYNLLTLVRLSCTDH